MANELQAPTLLLAMPQILDPFFHRSVVLLMAHGEEGSVGLVVNRPSELKITEILEDMSIDWGGDPSAAAFVGGPVQPQIGSVLYRAPGADLEDGLGTAVLPGLHVTQQLSDLEQLAGHPPSGLRLILGYAGWSAGQLLEEVLRNDWLTVPMDLDLVFSSSPDRAWESGLRSVGVDPALLATHSGSSDVTN